MDRDKTKALLGGLRHRRLDGVDRRKQCSVGAVEHEDRLRAREQFRSPVRLLWAVL